MIIKGVIFIVANQTTSSSGNPEIFLNPSKGWTV